MCPCVPTMHAHPAVSSPSPLHAVLEWIHRLTFVSWLLLWVATGAWLGSGRGLKLHLLFATAAPCFPNPHPASSHCHCAGLALWSLANYMQGVWHFFRFPGIPKPPPRTTPRR